jgi:hypothetical protein
MSRGSTDERAVLTMTPDVPQVVVFTPAMRTLIADAIESLILLLDEIDGDAGRARSRAVTRRDA